MLRANLKFHEKFRNYCRDLCLVNRLPLHKKRQKMECGERSNRRNKNIIDKLGGVFRQIFQMVSKNFIENPYPRIVRELI